MENKEQFDIEYVAKLARLELTEEEKEKYRNQLNSIIAYFQTLREVDTSGVEPTAHANPIFDVLRSDRAELAMSLDDALANAPSAAQGQIVVPRVVE